MRNLSRSNNGAVRATEVLKLETALNYWTFAAVVNGPIIN